MITPSGSQSQSTIAASDREWNSGGILFCGDAGGNWPKEQYENLKGTLQERISCLTAVIHSGTEPEAIANEVEQFVQQGVKDITFLPVSQLPLTGSGPIAHVISWSTQQWQELRFQVAPPLRWTEIGNWVFSTIQAEVKNLGVSAEATAVLLCGSGGNDSLQNADLARLGHLVCEQSSLHRVSSAFISEVRPTMDEAMTSVCREPVENVFIVPWQLAEFDKNRIDSVCFKFADSSGKCVRIVEMQLANSAMVNLLIANYLSAAPFEADRQSASGTELELTAAEQFELEQLRARIDELLPSEYQGVYETVSPQSMGTAKLKTDDSGRVAWDEIWTSFCDLALAGGPPHRGKLLEAVTSEEAMSDPVSYRSVVEEIRRGIGLVTHLETFESPTPGWVGIKCESEEMAVWLMRAIIVENVMVRREGASIFLPAGPKFTVPKEVKNVITSVAKTVHYWKSHLKSQKGGMA